MSAFDVQRRNGLGMRFSGGWSGWHGVCHITLESFDPHSRRTVMKFETVMLQSLFSVCLLICVLTVGGMLVA
jgi:hypothetical protein